jgi:glycosyltransferase involved in cell wall biosynthesis
MSDRKYERKNWILYLGRIHRVKAVDYIVEAFKLALPQLPPDYKLILCGVRNRQTPFEQELRKSIETSSIASRVEFHPWTTDAEKYYKQSRMLITGCANNQIIEAYACGTPVIALDLGETKNIYGHLKNVHIVEYPLGGYPTNAQEPSIDPECVDRVTRDTAELIKMISQQKNSYDIPMIDYDAVGWEQRLSKEAELYDMALRRRPLVRSVVRKASTVILKALFFCSR